MQVITNEIARPLVASSLHSRELLGRNADRTAAGLPEVSSDGGDAELLRWIRENAHLLKPPVNNFWCADLTGRSHARSLYESKDYTIMVVGGPNERNDYHFNETEEFFYQFKGPMLLKIIDDGKFVDHRIEEGSMFLLPRACPLIGDLTHSACTPHNPVRFADTIGLVIERRRPPESIDRLRWYCRSGKHEQPHIIHERSFHCTDLGSQLKPVILEWQTTESLRKCGECGWVAPAK